MEFLGDIAENEKTISKKLTEDKKDKNEKEISIDELEDSFKHYNGGKTPGVD